MSVLDDRADAPSVTNAARDMPARLLAILEAFFNETGVKPALVSQFVKRLGYEFQQELQRQKMAALKELAYGASHEINNPLANVSVLAQSLLADEKLPDRRRALAAIHYQSMRAHEMIADMMLFARPPAPRYADCEVSQLCQRAIGLVAPQAADLEVNLVVTDSAEATGRWDAEHIVMAIAALLRNAIEAAPASEGVVELSVRTMTMEAADAQFDGVEVRVQDNGQGFSEHARSHMFDPFFSGREAGRGLGFGLCKVYRIAELHHGDALLISSREGETVMAMRLPLNPDAMSTKVH